MRAYIPSFFSFPEKAMCRISRYRALGISGERMDRGEGQGTDDSNCSWVGLLVLLVVVTPCSHLEARARNSMATCVEIVSRNVWAVAPGPRSLALVKSKSKRQEEDGQQSS